jgi:hypothetical protein
MSLQCSFLTGFIHPKQTNKQTNKKTKKQGVAPVATQSADGNTGGQQRSITGCKDTDVHVACVADEATLPPPPKQRAAIDPPLDSEQIEHLFAPI